MKLIIDTANAKEIKRLSEILNVWGVTTNPTIITRENKPFKEVIDEIDKVLKEEQMLFVQVISTDYESMVKEGRYIASLRKYCSKNTSYCRRVKNNKDLAQGKIKVLLHDFQCQSRICSALNGVIFSPYVNKMSNYTDGIEETIILQEMLDANGLNSEIIAASLKIPIR